MAPTRSRHDDSPSYNPDVDRAASSGWKQLDTVSQRIVAWSLAFGIVLTVCAWVGKTLATDTRLTKLETEVAALRDDAKAIKNVACFLAKKSDQPITPAECGK